MRLNKFEDTTAAELLEHPKSQLKRSVVFKDGKETLSISFFGGEHNGGAVVCCSWNNEHGDWHGMNNLKNFDHGPGQAVTWAEQHDSGIKLAARYFLRIHAEADASIAKRDYEQRKEDRQARRERETERAADRKRRGIVLKGGTGQATGPLFKVA